MIQGDLSMVNLEKIETRRVQDATVMYFSRIPLAEQIGFMMGEVVKELLDAGGRTDYINLTGWYHNIDGKLMFDVTGSTRREVTL
jgi:hypothetical protein